MTGAAIRARGLKFAYGSHEVLHGLDFEVRRGEAHALLGPNGAGKTTTLRILLGLVVATGGAAEVLGQPAFASRAAIARHVGAVLEDNPLGEPTWSPREFLAYFGRLHGIAPAEARGRADALLQRLRLDRPGLRVGGMSQGMRRKLQIARALLHRPSILVLDEPSSGLDIPTKHDLWRVLRNLQAQERLTVLLSSHERDEVEQMVDRVSVIRSGRALGPLAPHRARPSHVHLGRPDALARALGPAALRPTGVPVSPGRLQQAAAVAGEEADVGPVFWGRDLSDTMDLSLWLLGVRTPGPGRAWPRGLAAAPPDAVPHTTFQRVRREA